MNRTKKDEKNVLFIHFETYIQTPNRIESNSITHAALMSIQKLTTYLNQHQTHTHILRLNRTPIHTQRIQHTYMWPFPVRRNSGVEAHL